MADRPEPTRATARPLIPTEKFKSQVSGYETLYGEHWSLFFDVTGACSPAGASNIMKGVARQTPRSLCAIGLVATLVGCPRHQVVEGVVLPPVPADVEIAFLDALAARLGVIRFTGRIV